MKSLMVDRDNVVEVPLDPKYLTPDGFYISGYLWGRHIRSVEGGLPEGADDAFKQGVEDGYGDGMARNIESLEANRVNYLKKQREEYWRDDQRR